MSALRALPRLLVAGMTGGSGKTLVALGLLLALRRASVPVRAFKKGPDYIDAAWLSWASGKPARNLDSFLMTGDTILSSFIGNGVAEGINIIEGARGIFDGFDVAGTHSTAVLAKQLKAPVVLVVNAAKVTRTAAALVLGCQKFDPELPVGGVILNNVNGRRHEQLLRGAIESTCSIPVVGAIPKAAVGPPLPERHLGLIPPEEHGDLEELGRDLLQAVSGFIDLDALVTLARSAAPLEIVPHEETEMPQARDVKIGYLKDSAFSFYYPENLELLERAGAELIPISALQASGLPADLNALYIGGGFPETHAEALSANRTFLQAIRRAAEEGLPVYAECGGLMLLSRALSWKGSRYEMADVFPFEVEVSGTAQGHGYSELRVDTPNPFFPVGSALRGHEFHYSRIVPRSDWAATACEVRRGTGCFHGRDAAIIRNVWASYTHLHALATPQWVKGVADAARRFVVHPAL
ncbi:MAG TPA: cobyrinate a,c-diamide synthase [Candidatus Acidoferrum sp.]|nr:cobyrinate a,c-diamide synthase [Candidatus Acidoferrum sp.]